MLRWSCLSLLLLSIVLLWVPSMLSTCFVAGELNPNSFAMVGANVQYNGMIGNPNATVLSNSTLKVVWVFPEPDADEFRGSPIYDANENAVYSAAFTGFVYSINALNGSQIWEACLGIPPTFPGDPCTESGIDEAAYSPYGQPSLLSDGNVIILRRAAYAFKDAMICLAKKDGSVLWSYQLPEYSYFASIPSPIPQPEGGDLILVWIFSMDVRMAYTVINGTTGQLVSNLTYPDGTEPAIAAMSYDPTDGTVISQWVDINTNLCNLDYPEFTKCTGVGKFDAYTGKHIWNVTMQTDWNNGMITLDIKRNSIYVTTTMEEIYAYTLDKGTPLWKADFVIPGNEMGWGSVCADGTLLITELDGGNVIAFDPTPERVMKAKWSIGPGYPISESVATLPDNTFVFQVQNVIYAHSCHDGSMLWYYDFGATDNGFGPSVAVADVGAFVNVYWPEKGLGMIAFLTDDRNPLPPFNPNNSTTAFS